MYNRFPLHLKCGQKHCECIFICILKEEGGEERGEEEEEGRGGERGGGGGRGGSEDLPVLTLTKVCCH